MSSTNPSSPEQLPALLHSHPYALLELPRVRLNEALEQVMRYALEARCQVLFVAPNAEGLAGLDATLETLIPGVDPRLTLWELAPARPSPTGMQHALLTATLEDVLLRWQPDSGQVPGQVVFVDAHRIEHVSRALLGVQVNLARLVAWCLEPLNPRDVDPVTRTDSSDACAERIRVVQSIWQRLKVACLRRHDGRVKHTDAGGAIDELVQLLRMVRTELAPVHPEATLDRLIALLSAPASQVLMRGVASENGLLTGLSIEPLRVDETLAARLWRVFPRVLLLSDCLTVGGSACPSNLRLGLPFVHETLLRRPTPGLELLLHPSPNSLLRLVPELLCRHRRVVLLLSDPSPLIQLRRVLSSRTMVEVCVEPDHLEKARTEWLEADSALLAMPIECWLRWQDSVLDDWQLDVLVQVGMPSLVHDPVQSARWEYASGEALVSAVLEPWRILKSMLLWSHRNGCHTVHLLGTEAAGGILASLLFKDLDGLEVHLVETQEGPPPAGRLLEAEA